MAHYEFLQIGDWKIMPNINGAPSTIHPEMDSDSLLMRKIIDAIYFSFRAGTTWEEAEAIRHVLKSKVKSLNVAHSA